MPNLLVPALALLAVSLAAAFARAAEAPLEQLGWLPGCWNAEKAEPGSGEQWMSIAGGTLLGMSRTVRGGKTVAYEFMRIGSTADGKLAFFAQPSGQAPASFALLRISASEVAFENPAHDFPQRIIYRLDSPARLVASIEGVRNGAARRIEFPMQRVACEEALTQRTTR